MNTADISVLSDELVVSLNPLRRGAQRARAACARLAGLALPWNLPSANAEPRRGARPAPTPARWPFPPAPAEAEALVGEAVASPAFVPAAEVRSVTPATPAARDVCLSNATVEPVTAGMTRKAMLIDVAMVLSWAAIIPGLMWLGAAAGF